jgi:hypothetical protein
MTEDAELIEKREDLKKQIRKGEYRQLANLDKIVAVFSR